MITGCTVFQQNAVFLLIKWFAFTIRKFLARINLRTHAVVAVLLVFYILVVR